MLRALIPRYTKVVIFIQTTAIFYQRTLRWANFLRSARQDEPGLPKGMTAGMKRSGDIPDKLPEAGYKQLSQAE